MKALIGASFYIQPDYLFNKSVRYVDEFNEA